MRFGSVGVKSVRIRGAKRAVLVAAIIALIGVGTAGAQEFLAYRLFVHVLAQDREAVSVALAEWGDRNGGYFVQRSQDTVVLRLPGTRLPAMRAFIRENDARILRYEPSTVNLRRELSDARAAVSSRQESLDRILALMRGADIGATLDFERELRSINQEIEYHRGLERRIVNDIRYATVHVALTSEQSSIPDYLPSAFAWINDVGIYRFLEDRS